MTAPDVTAPEKPQAVTVRLTRTMHEQLIQRAKTEERTAAAVLRRALRAYLDRPREETM